MGSMDIIAPHLPPYEKIDHAPNIQHNGIHGKEFADIIDGTYDELVKWRKNAFIVPSGKKIVNLLTFWLDHFNNNTCYKGIALKVFMVLPSLLLQKPSTNSKMKEHSHVLEGRIKLWNEGRINELLIECRSIQRKLALIKTRSTDDARQGFLKTDAARKDQRSIKIHMRKQ